MNVLFLGDIVGNAGRRAVCSLLPGLIHREQAAFVVANCENASGGNGVKPEDARKLLGAGIDVLTSGNHIWRYKEIVPYIEGEHRLIRPANFPAQCPGLGWARFRLPDETEVAVINLIGRVFMDSVDCPFQVAEKVLSEIPPSVRVIVVDMHAETTSEKGAMGWHLDGRVSAVLGTHTHVQTADERVLPNGTAFLTDVGMCGPTESVIGVRHELVLHRFLTHMPTRFEPAGGAAVVQGAVVTVDPSSGRASAVRRVREFLP